MTASQGEREKGLAARRAGRHEAALVHFRASGMADPADRWSRCDAVAELVALQRLAEAEIEARRLCDEAPDFAPAHRALALALRAKGDRSGALDAFREAAAADPRDLWNRHDAGVELRALDRCDEAKKTLRDVADGTPLPHALRGLAEIERAKGAHETALALFQAAAHLRPADPFFALDVATTLRTLGRLSEAEAACAALLARHPDFVPALCEAAELRALTGGQAEAETLFARLLVRDPGLVPAYRGLARLAAGRGDFDRAAAHLAAAAKVRGNDAQIVVEQAGLLKRAGRWHEARSLLQALLARPEVTVAARLELYPIRKRDEGAEAALALLRQAVDLDARNPRTLLMLGDHAREAGGLDEADGWYDRALEARSGFTWALAGKASIARAKGKLETAAALLETAVASDAQDGHAALELAALHRESGDFALARTALARVPPASPRMPQAAVAEGFVLRAQGRWREAADAFLAAAGRFPSHVEALVEAAEDFARSGEDEKASAALADAGRLAPDHPAVVEALARRALAREDHEAALAHLGRAATLDPARIWPPLAVARIRAMLGDAPGALADLAASSERFGARPEIMQARVELLRQTGEMERARELLAEARGRFAHHAGLRQQGIVADIEDGRFERAARAIEAGMASAAPEGVEAGRLHFLRSLLAAARWDMRTAIAAGEAAVARLPADGWARNRLIHAALVDLDLVRAGRHLGALAELEATASRAKGKSANASQSHYGQIFDEFRLDAEALEAIGRARALAPQNRLAALGRTVLDHPDSTAAAIRFFVERRLHVAASPPVAAEGVIPRTIHQYWNDPILPDDVGRYAASWPATNPGFGYRRWSEAEARDFIADLSPEALTAFERAREPAMKADLFRLALLAADGGVYADMDDRCLAGIEPLLTGGHGMVVYQEDLGSLGNNFIAAAPRHPVIERALRLGVEAVNRGDADILWLGTGPGLLTRAAAQVMCEAPERADTLRVLDRHELTAHVAIHCLAGYKATERHWSRTAFGRARRPQAARSRAS